MRVARLVFLAALFPCMAIPFAPTFGQERAVRVEQGLLVLYDFTEETGQIVHDHSGNANPLNLTIGNPANVRWEHGALNIESATTLVSSEPTTRLIDAVKKSNALTVETWLEPANDKQSGPARIISLSRDTNQRNVTLGQDGDLYDVRLRATGSDNNGLPSTSSPKKSLQTRTTHVVYTRDASGSAILYINGKQAATKQVKGNLSNWNNQFPLILANEQTGDRPWLGRLELVAIYDRALPLPDVLQNHAAGLDAKKPALTPQMLAARHFETTIAPLLAKHCLECHDTVTSKGGLDFSRKTTAFKGGDSGKAIVAGNLKESLLWDSVTSDEMPKKRSPMSAQEKEALKQWIEQGAVWTLDVIDPALYTRGNNVAENWLRRLTVPEYIETVRATVGVDIAEDARRLLPPDLRADGFSNTAYNLNVDLGHVEAYAELAELIVARMDVKEFASKFSKKRRLDGDELAELISKMGKWLLRGPLDPREINTYRGIATTVASGGGDFDESISYVIEGMLQSPRFLYRIEYHFGEAVKSPIGQFELASRMSYILWGAPPDAELMKAAEAGDLANLGRVEAHVKRMLEDPRAIDRSARFIHEWLNLGHLNNLQPNRDRFPNWDQQLADDMRNETLTFFKEVAWKQQRPLEDLLNAQVTFVTPRLARHYGLKPQGDGVARYDLSAVPDRGGLLTQGSVLTVGGDDASMVSRGLFVLHDFLRGVVKDPPPCVDTTPIPTKAGLTQRSIAESRLANTSCSGCHTKFEPLAFGLEKFDGLGAFHQQDEHGNRLREDGEILFPGEAEPRPFKTSAELMNLLAESERVRECITWKVTQFALGRPLVAADAPTLQSIHQSVQQGGGTYRSLITAIVMSDLVQRPVAEKRK